jgi:hypothetical protein
MRAKPLVWSFLPARVSVVILQVALAINRLLHDDSGPSVHVICIELDYFAFQTCKRQRASFLPNHSLQGFNLEVILSLPVLFLSRARNVDDLETSRLISFFSITNISARKLCVSLGRPKRFSSAFGCHLFAPLPASPTSFLDSACRLDY